MAVLLVIERNPELRQLIREAIPSDWRFLEAADGLSGLDLVRQHVSQLDLILLAMDLPDLTGPVACMRIREYSTAIPILPLSEATHNLPVMTELGCLPALIKPIRFSELRSALLNALQQPTRPLAPSAVLDWAQEQSRIIEQQARHAPRVLRVAIFATSQVKRAGLARMLGGTAEIAEASTLTALQSLVAGGRFTVLVSDAADHGNVLPLARSYGIPLILVVATLEQARALHTADVAAVILESDRTAAVRLAIAVEAIANGEPHFAQRIDMHSTIQPGRVVPPILAQRFAGTPLSQREQEVLWLDFQGLSTEQIAHYLTINPQTVGSHWKGAQRKVQMRRSALRAWVHMLLSERALSVSEMGTADQNNQE